MAKDWQEVRAKGRSVRVVDEENIASLREQMRTEVRAYRLAEVRKAQHVSQTVLASAMGVKQPRVSAIERGEIGHTEFATIQSYVEALGGRVRIVADLGDEALTIG